LFRSKKVQLYPGFESLCYNNKPQYLQIEDVVKVSLGLFVVVLAARTLVDVAATLVETEHGMA
jgi:hypothetical protein